MATEQDKVLMIKNKNVVYKNSEMQTKVHQSESENSIDNINPQIENTNKK